MINLLEINTKQIIIAGGLSLIYIVTGASMLN